MEGRPFADGSFPSFNGSFKIVDSHCYSTSNLNIWKWLLHLSFGLRPIMKYILIFLIGVFSIYVGVLKTLNINTWAGQDIQACLNGVPFPAEEDKKRERRGRGWGGGRGNQKPYLIWDFLLLPFV